MRLRRESRDRGAGLAEYAGLIVLAALILGVLVPVIAPPVKDNVAYALCKILAGGDASKCTSPQDKKYKPNSCQLATSTDTYGGKVTVAFFEVGKDLTFVRTTTVDNNGNKKVTITAVDNTSLGVTTGIGAGGHAGPFNAGANASVGANLKVGIGDSWTFTGKKNEAEDKANHFIGDVREAAGIKAVEHSGIAGWALGHAYDTVAGPDDLPDPTTSRTEFSLNGTGSVSAGLGLGLPSKKGKSNGEEEPPPTQSKPKSRRQKFNEKYDKRQSNRATPSGSNPSGFSPSVSGSVSVNAGAKGIIEHNSDGSSAVTLQLSGKLSGSESHVVGSNNGSLGTTGAVKVTKDKNGTVTGLDLTRSTIVGGKATTTTTHLTLDNDQERQAVANNLIGAGGSGTALNLTWDDLAPTNPPGPDANPLQKLLYDKGQTTRQTYSYNSSDQQYGLSVKYGVALGIQGGVTSEGQKLTGAQYLGAPGADGVRRYQNYKECHE